MNNGVFILLFLLIAIGLRVSPMAVTKADTSIIRVPTDFPTIQEAINAALPESTILVNSGTYHEHLIVNKTVQLLGIDRMTTIIDGDGNGIAVTVTANNVLVNGFTVQDSWHAGFDFLTHGSIQLIQSNNCTITDNVVTSNVFNGIFVENSNNTVILANVITLNSGSGISVVESNNCTITDNVVTSNVFNGIFVENSNNTVILANVITLNGGNGGLSGSSLHIFGSYNNTIKGNIILRSFYSGIEFESNYGALVQLNVIMDSTLYDIVLFSANGSRLDHNSFFKHSVPVDSEGSYNNTWDDGTQGNYWDDYVGLDDGSNGRVAGDGVGDAGLPVHGVDNYPLVRPPQPIPIVWENTVYPVNLNSNSTVSSFSFVQAEKKIVFSVVGPSNTTGYFNATLPTVLLSGNPWKITLNGTDVTSQAVITTNQTDTSIYLAYDHNSHDVQLIGTSVVPEYPTHGILALIALLMLLSLITYKTNKRSPHSPALLAADDADSNPIQHHAFF